MRFRFPFPFRLVRLIPLSKSNPRVPTKLLLDGKREKMIGKWLLGIGIGITTRGTIDQNHHDPLFPPFRSEAPLRLIEKVAILLRQGVRTVEVMTTEHVVHILRGRPGVAVGVWIVADGEMTIEDEMMIGGVEVQLAETDIGIMMKIARLKSWKDALSF
jgi:hypothetical protein